MIAKYEQRALSVKNHISIHRYKDLQNLPHWHAEHELIYVANGKIELIVNNSPCFLEQNQAAFVKSGDIHYIKSATNSVTVVMKIYADSVCEIVDGYTLTEPRLLGDYAIFKVLEEIREELQSRQLFSETIASGLMKVLIAKIFRGEKKSEFTAQSGDPEHRYKDLLKRMQRDYRNINFDEAAKFMHFSKPYFSSYFYNRTGMTFTHYLNMLRVSAAARLVTENSLRMTEISDHCGFGTIRSFNRVFKEYTGFSPKELPHDYIFLRNADGDSNTGFDPTLNGTEVLD